MRERELKHFQSLLQEKLDELLKEADRTVDGMTDAKAENFPDPTDRASLESNRNFTLRIRDRERKLIVKIKEALGADRRRQLRQVRGVRREDRPRAPGSPTGHDPLHRLQVAAGSPRAQAPRRLIPAAPSLSPRGSCRRRSSRGVLAVVLHPHRSRHDDVASEAHVAHHVELVAVDERRRAARESAPPSGR